MKIIVDENIDYDEIEIIVKCQKQDEKIIKIIQFLETNNDTVLCKKNKEIYKIALDNILYIESIDEKTFVYVENQIFENSSKLYELENQLQNRGFVRISKSSILNLQYLKNVKALINGKYEVTLTNEEKLVVSRKYMPAFKKEFGI